MKAKRIVVLAAVDVLLDSLIVYHHGCVLTASPSHPTGSRRCA
jgi:hypothetical protein